jgi:hypothetical protein
MRVVVVVVVVVVVWILDQSVIFNSVDTTALVTAYMQDDFRTGARLLSC